MNSTCMGLKLSMVKVNLEIGCFAKINMQILEWDNGSFMQSKIDIKCPLPRDIFYCKCFFKKAEKNLENLTQPSNLTPSTKGVKLRSESYAFQSVTVIVFLSFFGNYQPDFHWIRPHNVALLEHSPLDILSQGSDILSQG